jgi:hypothetical protein
MNRTSGPEHRAPLSCGVLPGTLWIIRRLSDRSRRSGEDHHGRRVVALRFQKGGRTLATATIFRGRQSLEAELAMERGRSP